MNHVVIPFFLLRWVQLAQSGDQRKWWLVCPYPQFQSSSPRGYSSCLSLTFLLSERERKRENILLKSSCSGFNTGNNETVDSFWLLLTMSSKSSAAATLTNVYCGYQWQLICWLRYLIADRLHLAAIYVYWQVFKTVCNNYSDCFIFTLSAAVEMLPEIETCLSLNRMGIWPYNTKILRYNIISSFNQFQVNLLHIRSFCWVWV